MQEHSRSPVAKMYRALGIDLSYLISSSQMPGGKRAVGSCSVAALVANMSSFSQASSSCCSVARVTNNKRAARNHPSTFALASQQIHTKTCRVETYEVEVSCSGASTSAARSAGARSLPCMLAISVHEPGRGCFSNRRSAVAPVKNQCRCAHMRRSDPAKTDVTSLPYQSCHKVATGDQH